jgi:hypothetical protein
MTDERRSLAKSPYELRVDLGADVPEGDVRSALASGDMGFLHSYHHRRRGRRARRARRRRGRPAACGGAATATTRTLEDRQRHARCRWHAPKSEAIRAGPAA